jgi:hypothetical protein
MKMQMSPQEIKVPGQVSKRGGESVLSESSNNMGISTPTYHYKSTCILKNPSSPLAIEDEDLKN